MCVYSSVLKMLGIQLAPSQQQNAPIHIEPETCQPLRNCFLLHIRLSRQQKRTLLSILGSILLILYAMQSLVTIQLAKDTTMEPNVDAILETPSASEVAAGKWWACYSLMDTWYIQVAPLEQLNSQYPSPPKSGRSTSWSYFYLHRSFNSKWSGTSCGLKAYISRKGIILARKRISHYCI